MKTIYEPSGRAREYAALALNIYSGCDHACQYCYAPNATFQQREAFINPRTRPGLISALESDARSWSGQKHQVLLCFTCDPYSAFDSSAGITRQAIVTLKRNGFKFCTLTKGGRRALRDIDLFGDGDAFATTMTLLSPDHSAKWEPGAASPQERMDVIKEFYDAGIYTWVSLEPVLNPDSALRIIEMTSPFVNLFKLGKLNHHPLAEKIDWAAYTDKAVRLVASTGRDYIIKNDLHPFVPSGFSLRTIPA